MAERNALAKLAETLKYHDCHDDDFYTAVDKAQRIVAELERIKPDQFACGCLRNLLDKCRAIAEEREVSK